jgi:hypothetical protein
MFLFSSNSRAATETGHQILISVINKNTHTHARVPPHTHCEQGQDCQCADTPYNQLQCCELLKVYLIPVINIKKCQNFLRVLVHQ